MRKLVLSAFAVLLAGSVSAVAEEAVAAKVVVSAADTKAEALSEGPAVREPAAAPVKPKPIAPTLVATIDLSSQTMTVTRDGSQLHHWKISSGRSGYITPRGSFRPKWMSKMWYSRQYDGAPMPYAVFFNGGIATHGTSSVGMLGRPASHGCIRLHTSNARTFYNLVSKHGKARTRIVVTGTTPVRSTPVASRQRRERVANYGSNTRISRSRPRQSYGSYQPWAQPTYRPAPRYRVRTAQPRLIYPGDRW